MIRSVAVSVLVALSLAITLPAFAPAPAHAATTSSTTDGLPSIPWVKVGQWLLKNALTLFMLAEEIWHQMSGGNNNPPPEQPPPAGAPCNAPDPELELAFALPGAVGGFA